jgi:ATP/ADP translocase/HEAT repeat protein
MSSSTDERSWLTRVVDIRQAEIPAGLQAFVALLLILTAHTVLETARDALLITRLPPRSLGVVYVAVAVCVLPVAALASKVSARFGARRALGGALLLAVVALVTLYVVRTTPISVVGIYVASGLVGAVVVPQFWSLVGSFFSVAQARRLLGPIAAAGVIGATLGSSLAAALLMVLRVKALLLVSGGILMLAVAVVSYRMRPEALVPPVPDRSTKLIESSEELRREPFLRRIALLVVASTAAAVAIDYFFKWTVARDVPPTEVARFVARYYAALNGLSLVAQVFVSGALVRRVGVATAGIVTPLLLALSALGAFAVGGALAGVLVLRAVDGALINSVHRVTTELVYLPVPHGARARAKPFIDGALARTTQAIAGILLFAAGASISPRILAGVCVLVAVGWLATALTTRRPYLDLLRRAIARGGAADDAGPIDLENAAALVQLLAHDDPALVLGAMNALARRGRERLIPALVLLHEDEAVVVRALALFDGSEREDWVPRARRLLLDPRGVVRKAAARALARHGKLDLGDLARDASPWVRGYVALHASLAVNGAVPLPGAAGTLRRIVEDDGPDAEELRLGLLSAIADVPRDRAVLPLLLELAESAPSTREWSEGLARAAVTQRASVLIPDLIERLSSREGREAVRDALAQLGPQALTSVWHALQDTKRQRALRVHLPNTLARFGTAQAAELLLECVETEPDGLVRYKALRALQRLAIDKQVTSSRPRVEALIRRNLGEHLRLLGLRAAFRGATLEAPTEYLLLRLLDDKLSQSRERAFLLLQIGHPAENIRSVRLAFASSDRRTRANALELVDTLLARRDQRMLSAMLRLAVEDLPPSEWAARAGPYLDAPVPTSPSEALAVLAADADHTVAALAQLHMATLAGETKRVALSRRTSTRPSVELETASLPTGVVGG